MRRFYLATAACLLIVLLFLQIPTFGQNNFRTIATGNWNATATWERDVDGDFIYEESPATVTPTSADGQILITNTYTVTVTASVSTDETIIQSGGTVTINSGQVLTVAAGAGDDLTIDGDLVNNGTLTIFNDPPPPPISSAFVQVNGTLTNTGTINNAAVSRLDFADGADYDHAFTTTAGTIPTANWDSNSTVTISGYTSNGNPPAGLGQTFGNFVWNTPSLGSFIDLNAALNDVDGDLTITSAPAYVAFTQSTALTLSVGGDMSIGAEFLFSDAANVTVNVTGNTEFSGGVNFFTGDGDITLNLTGDLTFSGGTHDLTYGAGDTDFNLTGDLAFTGGSLSKSGTGIQTILFEGVSAQSVTGTSTTISNDMEYDVFNSSIVDLGTSALIGDALNVQANAILRVGSTHASGAIQTGTTAGNIRVTNANRTYSSSSTIVYNGLAAQQIGNGFPSNVNLTISNTSGVSFSGILAINSVNALTISASAFIDIGTNELQINGSVAGSGTITGGSLSDLTIGGVGALGTINFTSGSRTLQNFTINRTASGTVTLGTDLQISASGTLTQTAGRLIINGQSLTILGDYARTSGNIQSNDASTLILQGSDTYDPLSFFTGSSLGTFTIDNANGASTGSGITIAASGSLNLTEGTFAGAGSVTMGNNSTVDRGLGSTAKTFSTSGTYNVNYSGTSPDPTTPGNELPTNATDLGNLTISGGVSVDLASAITVNGTLSLSNGTLNMGTNNFTIDGTSWTDTGGDFTINSANTVTVNGALVMTGTGGTTLGNLNIASGGSLTLPSAVLNISGNLDNDGTLTAAGTVNITGNLDNDGTLTAGSAQLEVAGNWDNNLGTFTAGTSTVILDGSGNQQIDPDGDFFNNITFSGGMTKTLQGAIDVNGNLTISSGSTLDVGSNFAINVAGSWINSGTFVPSGGTVTFDGTSQTITSSGQAFFGLTLANSGTKTLGDALDVNGALTINSGVTLDVAVGAFAISSAGNWINNGTDFNARTGTVTFDGSTTTTISGSTTTDFHSITIAKTGSTVTAPAGNLDVTGNWLYSSGTFANGGGTVRFNGGGNQNITSGAQAFNNVTVANLNTKTLQDNVDINGNLTLSGGTFSAGADRTINLAGNFDASGGGVFTAASGQIIFDGTTQSVTSASEVFNSVQVAGSSTLTVVDALDINGNLDIDGTLTVGSQSINVAGNWDATGGSFTTTGSTTFDGAAQNITSNGGTFGPVTISGSSTKTLQDAFDVNGNLTVTSTLSVGSSNAVTVSGNWDSGSGTFTAASGLVTLDGAAQSITIGGANAFNDLTVAGTDTKTMLDELDIDDDLVISSTLSAGTDNDILIGGDWTNNGTFTSAAGLVTFDGGGTSNVAGTSNTQFNDITSSGSTVVEIETTHSMTGTLTLAGTSTFDADGGTDVGVFTLLSSADNPTTDANVAAIPGTATFQGDLTVQRFMSSEGGVWRYISTPVSGLTVADWQTEFPVSGTFTGTDNGTGGIPSNALPSLYYYDETDMNTINDGYIAHPTSANTETVDPGVGYSAFMRSSLGQVTIDQRGPINQGAFDFTTTANALSYTNTGSAPDDGWNLIGNPYPSAIDWDALWTANEPGSNVDPTMYIRDNPNTQFATFNANTNTGTNGGTKNVAIAQSFWVHATGSPTLSLTESEKTTDSHEFFKEEIPINYIRITLTDGVVGDETLIHFFDDAISGLDGYDSYKLQNEGFNLSTLMENGEDLVINAAGSLDCDAEIAINITEADPGSYSLNFTEFESFIDDFEITLRDNFENVDLSVRENPSYPFEITTDPQSTGNARFSIYFGTSQIDTSLNLTAASEACTDSEVEVFVDDSQIGIDYQVYIDGSPVSDPIIGDGTTISLLASMEGLAEGEYTIEVMAIKPGCSSLPLQQESGISISAIPADAVVTDSQACLGESSTLQADGAPVDGSYNWYSSLTAPDPILGENASTFVINNLLEDETYYVVTVNSLGCESPTRMAVSANVEVSTEIASVTDDEVCENGSATLTVSGAGTGEVYNWYTSLQATEPTGHNDPILSISNITETTSYFVTITNASGCESAVRAEVIATVVDVEDVESVEASPSCEGQAVTLTASGATSGSTYSWYETVDATAPIEGITGADLVTDPLSEDRSYFVAIVNSLGCEGPRLEAIANVEPIFEVTGVESATVCPGETVTLVASGAPEGTTYQWYDGDGVAIEGANVAEFTTGELTTSTAYSVSILSSNGCMGPSFETTAEVSEDALEISSESQFVCGEGEVTLVAAGTPVGGSYVWYNANGEVIEGETGSQLTVSVVNSTTYSVQSVSSTGCTSELFDVIAEVRELPAIPVIVQDQNFILTESAADSYQWYKDGNPIDGENGSTLRHADDFGSYQVEIIVNDCSSISEPFLVTGLDDLSESNRLRVYPNPAKKVIEINLTGIQSESVRIFVLDINGRIIHREEMKNHSGAVTWQHTINSYDNGVYFVKLSDGLKTYSGRFVKK